MATKHTLLATIPVGDPDLGAEIDVEITFTFLRGAPERGPDYWSGGQPADPDEIEFVSAVQLVNGKPAPSHHGAFADMQKDLIDDLASAWLESDDGTAEAFTTVREDDEYAREQAAEARAEMRREDR